MSNKTGGERRGVIDFLAALGPILGVLLPPRGDGRVPLGQTRAAGNEGKNGGEQEGRESLRASALRRSRSPMTLIADDRGRKDLLALCGSSAPPERTHSPEGSWLGSLHGIIR